MSSGPGLDASFAAGRARRPSCRAVGFRFGRVMSRALFRGFVHVAPGQGLGFPLGRPCGSFRVWRPGLSGAGSPRSQQAGICDMSVCLSVSVSDSPSDCLSLSLLSFLCLSVSAFPLCVLRCLSFSICLSVCPFCLSVMYVWISACVRLQLLCSP